MNVDDLEPIGEGVPVYTAAFWKGKADLPAIPAWVLWLLAAVLASAPVIVAWVKR